MASKKKTVKEEPEPTATRELRITTKGATEEVKKQVKTKTIKLESVDDSPHSDESFRFLMDEKSSNKTGSPTSV